MTSCIFCQKEDNRVYLENDLAYVMHDGFPVTPAHSLIIPKRHVQDYFGLTRDELLACDQLIRDARGNIQADDDSVEGFNIGANCGSVAGQTIFHCHLHLIPRRSGDVQEPRGGLRHMIPGKGTY